MTDHEQIEAVEDIMFQVARVKHGLQKSIKCPFCGEFNMKRVASDPPEMWIRPGISPFCCERFEVVANACAGRFLKEAPAPTEKSGDEPPAQT